MSYIYAGLAGDTSPGIEWVEKHMGMKMTVNNGLFRRPFGEGNWELITKGLPERPEIRAITVHPKDPNTVYVATQDGPYRTDDQGDHWERVDVPSHGLPMWSLLFHPRDPNVMYAGYENCEIYRSEDGGQRWSQLPVSVRFPQVTMPPRGIPAKRVLMIGASASDSDQLFASLEVGGLIRSLDGGDHWENLSEGQYLSDDTVDMHGVLVSRYRPDTVISICRVGIFRSTDRGDHWENVRIDSLNPDKGTTYCRCIREEPGDPRSIWISAGGDFESNVGGLFHSEDGGLSFDRVDIGYEPDSTLFAVALDRRNPKNMCCASKNGQVFASDNGGVTWTDYPLPASSSQVYCLATA